MHSNSTTNSTLSKADGDKQKAELELLAQQAAEANLEDVNGAENDEEELAEAEEVNDAEKDDDEAN